MQPNQDRRIYRREYAARPSRGPAASQAPVQPAPPQSPPQYQQPYYNPPQELHVEPGYQMPTPRLDRPDAPTKSAKLPIPSRRASLAVAALALVVLAGLGVQKSFFGGSSTQAHAQKPPAQATQASADVNSSLPKVTTSDYKYDSFNKKATYIDKIGVVALSVTEQTQPLSKKTISVDLLKSTADQLGTSSPIVVNNGAAFEVLTNGGKNQTVIFSSGRIIVSVNSSLIIGPTFWQQFINGFKAKTPS